MPQRYKAKMNIPMCAAGVLLCLTLFSMCLTSGLYARYTSKDFGSDAARVAQFSVNLNGADNDLIRINVGQGETSGSYIFYIENDSEVAIRYDVILTFTTEIPQYVSVMLNGKTGVANGTQILFEDVGTIAPNAAEARNDISFIVNDVESFSDGASGNSHDNNLNFNAEVKCVQID